MASLSTRPRRTVKAKERVDSYKVPVPEIPDIIDDEDDEVEASTAGRSTAARSNRIIKDDDDDAESTATKRIVARRSSPVGIDRPATVRCRSADASSSFARMAKPPLRPRRGLPLCCLLPPRSISYVYATCKAAVNI